MAAYTDKELSMATTVAYLKLGDSYEDLKKKHSQTDSRTSFTIQELIDNDNAASKQFVKEMDERGYSQAERDRILNWKLSAVKDTNKETGFYACVVETDDNNAILAYRGSEGFGTSERGLSNLQNDWINTNLNLLNNDLDVENSERSQYTDAADFLRENADLINSYDKVSLTGHSLGGNLAEFSAITASENGCGSNFERCLSLDGPGFSEEFIDFYRKKGLIPVDSSKIDHYKYSLVGSCLKDVPGENSKFIKVKWQDRWNPLGRHSTGAIEYDENGCVKEWHQDPTAWIVDNITNIADDLPPEVGNKVRDILSEALLLGFYNADEIKNKLISFAEKHPLLTIGTIGSIASICLPVALGYLAHEYILGPAYEFLVDGFKKIKGWTTEKYQEFCAVVRKKIQEYKEWCKTTFDKNYRAAKEYLGNEYILQLDTGELINLADRLWAINGRLESLDHRLEGLYKTAKWTDLGNFIKVSSADLKIGRSGRINKCAHCLRDTATRFERAEKEILNML